jgi:phosphoribosylformylglycinamidine synthase
MKFGVIQFPGSNCDQDAYFAVRDVLKQPVEYVWHQVTDVSGYDCIILPGGFSYGDYLRTGAVARFSPVMNAVQEFADKGGRVIGICNGFQILCEAHMLPGALLPNNTLRFRCRYVNVRVENNASDYTHLCDKGQVLRIPIAHHGGQYYCDPDTLKELEANNRILLRYCDDQGNITEAGNPNGSLASIAGIVNERGNVAGMMPHPERAVEDLLGSADGVFILKSIVERLS